MKASMQGFKDFVKSQPREELINHSFWSTCALGEYYDEIGKTFYRSTFMDTTFKADLCEGATKLEVCAIEVLNRNGRLFLAESDALAPPVAVNNYGDLQDFFDGKFDFDVEKYYDEECSRWWQ